MQAIPKNYDPSTVEGKWYAYWEEHGFFHADPDPSRPPYTIVIPPPNVTGQLHMGHMLNNTLQDVLIRRKRMEGYNACWVPGTDHASIATETKVVQKLASEGIQKRDLTREEFLEHAWAWTHKYGGIILDQLKKLGASLDWRRTRFTMEDSLYRAVIRVFVDLHDKGLIYRGIRMVNWDPVGRTALSDEEVNYQESQGKLYYLRYPIEGSESEGIIIATTRPETILADTGIACHPDDERYRHLLGKNALVPFVNRPIPIVADTAIEMEFGTGCLKVTPAHDIVDYEIGLRHNLPVIDMLDEDGSVNENAEVEAYIGRDRFEVRKQIVKDLEAAGYLIKTEDHMNKVGTSERTKAVIEPRLSMQWFLKMQPLAEPALKAVLAPEHDGVRLIPDRFLNTYRHWMENIRDWCISRQLWWGHRIPAYYYGTGAEEYVVAETREAALERARARGFTGQAEDLCQDEDVLDTWFSSWLWPMTVFDGLEDPDNPDIQYFYPTSDLITGPDILFFWVARMIMAGIEYRGQVPFRNVYLTGIVRDIQRRKMSKSLGNSPEPLELIEQYSADGVRVGMLLCSAAGNDLLFEESLCEQGRNFANKIWNAFRLLHTLGENAQDTPPTETQQLAHTWMTARLAAANSELTDQFEQFRISEALMTVYRLFWDSFCSWYLEMIKPAPDQALSRQTYEAAADHLEYLLRLIHPFMPFITEEIWHLLRERDARDCIIVANMPEAAEFDRTLLAEMEVMQELITAVRAFRSEKQLSPRQPIALHIKTTDEDLFARYRSLLEKFLHLEAFEFTQAKPEGSLSIIVRSHELFIPLAGMIDVEAERKKLEEEIQYTEGFLRSVDKKLSNEKFVQNARPEVVAREQQKKADAEARLNVLRESLAGLG